VEFEAEDEAKLVGYYYPSKYAHAPVMILMHWAGGDLCDWSEIALWLQNRRAENPAPIERCANPGSAPWRDPSWFPAMAPDASIAVFAFDFRGHGESERGGAGSILVKDAKAAFATAAGLKGVDASRLAALGASIGADGAVDGCLRYNQEAGSGCVGAFPLSPDSYLGMRYTEVVDNLSPVPVWCHAGELDRGPARSCEAAYGEGYNFLNYPGTEAHGMQLISPELDPPVLVLVQVFIESVFMEWVEVQ
jgi:pimeloyl-ACP methyl ester carboxylesterase